MTLNWTKGLFSSTYRLRRGEEGIGQLKLNCWKSTATGNIGEKQYLFKPRRWFSGAVDIVEVSSGKKAGEIESSIFSSKRILRLGEEEPLTLEGCGFFRQSWQLKQSTKVLIEYHPQNTRGQIRASEGHSKLMILAGIYGINQFYEYLAVVIGMAVVIISA